MAAGVKVGNFTKSTNTSTPVDQSITGVGFEPKGIKLIASVLTTADSLTTTNTFSH